MERVLQNRGTVAFGVCVLTGIIGNLRFPFPAQNVYLQLLALKDPPFYMTLVYIYSILFFSSSFWVYWGLLSVAFVFHRPKERRVRAGRLPLYPSIEARRELSVVLGELHHPTKPIPSESPRHLEIQERGLYAGLAVFGRIGSGKTAGLMRPVSRQILGYMAHDHERRAAGFVMEVKGDFCQQIRHDMAAFGRTDFISVEIGGAYCCNPLHEDIDAYSAAFQIASLLGSLWGKGKEPFWTQAYCNMMQFLIKLHRLLFDYVTLLDVYLCALKTHLLASRIAAGEELFRARTFIVVSAETMSDPNIERRLSDFHFEGAAGGYRARFSKRLQLVLELSKPPIPYEGVAEAESPDVDPGKRQEFEAVKTWYYDDWGNMDPKLRTSIVEGISIFLSIFDNNPALKATFCPPKEAYDPSFNPPGKGKYAQPLPPFAELIERGFVVGLQFPIAENPGLAVTIGTLMKMGFQRAALLRIPKMAAEPERHFRPVLLAIDEYHMYATSGGPGNPTGDDKFFSLSRQAKVIPCVASQSISSMKASLHGEHGDAWRALLQCFGTQVFLATMDELTANYARALCGKEDRGYTTYHISESSHDAKVSLFSGRTLSNKANVTASKTYNTRIDDRFRGKAFTSLKNYQAIAIAYDGVNPIEPTYCYLMPHYLDPNMSWFEKLERALL
jgi:hypothetical protein